MKGAILTLSTDIGRHAQDVNYTELIRAFVTVDRVTAPHTLRVHIRSNSYREQCHATIERWDGTGWRFVHGIDTGAMETPDKLCYANEGKPDPRKLAYHFEADRNVLLDRALSVIKERES